MPLLHLYKKLVIVTAALCCIGYHDASAQTFYTTSGPQIQKVTLTPNACTTTTLTTCITGTALSIAIYKNNFYYIDGNVLYAGTLTSNAVTNCKQVLQVPFSNSLTVDKAGLLYLAADKKLYTVDPAAAVPTLTSLGDMPFSAGGDLLFYNDTLYLAATVGIVKVNIAAPAQSTLFIPSGQVIFGLAAASFDCYTNKVYSFSTAMGSTNVTEVDLVNGQFGGISCAFPYIVLDAASEVEDGSFSNIHIKELNVRPTCVESNKGNIEVITEFSTVQFTYLFNNSISNTTGVFPDVPSGIYPLRITSPGGCLKDTFITVPAYDIRKPTIQPVVEKPTCREDGKVSFDAGNDNALYTATLLGTKYPATQVFTLPEGTHHFRLRDRYECPLDSFDIAFTLPAGCDTIYFPNAFTPGKANNNTFKSSINITLRNYQLRVYNRWGQLLFTTNDIRRGWNGNFGNHQQSTGTYVWVATYLTRDGKPRMQKGSLVLIR
jgi:gliding motility-associated-like protein